MQNKYHFHTQLKLTFLLKKARFINAKNGQSEEKVSLYT